MRNFQIQNIKWGASCFYKIIIRIIAFYLAVFYGILMLLNDAQKNKERKICKIMSGNS